MLESGLLGLLTGYLASVFSWQMNLFAIQRGLEGGRRACFLVGMGAVLADFLIILFIVTSASPLLHNEQFWGILRVFGIGTLGFLGFSILFRKHEFLTKIDNKREKSARNFLVGFLLVIANPAVFLLWIGVMGFLLTHFPHILHSSSLFFSGFLLGAVFWFFMLAFWMLPHTKTWREEHLYWISKVSAVVLLAVAAWLFFKKF